MKKKILIAISVALILGLGLFVMFQMGVIGRNKYQKIAGTYTDGLYTLTLNADQTGAMTVRVLLTTVTSPLTYEIEGNKMYLNVQGSATGNTMLGYSSNTFKLTKEGMTLVVDGSGLVLTLKKVG